MTTLVWLQRELRLQHVPALTEAIQLAQTKPSTHAVIWVYFHDPQQVIGQANSVWLAHSLMLLQQQVRQAGGQLWVIEGEFKQNLQRLIEHYAVDTINYSFQVGEPFRGMQQQALEVCQKRAVKLQPFFSETLMEPEQIKNQKGKPYAVFTPFYKTLTAALSSVTPFESCSLDFQVLNATPIDKEWTGLPESLQRLMNSQWAKQVMSHWRVGEALAWERLDQFLTVYLSNYAEDRDFPALKATSQLSAHLHFGEITTRDIYFCLQGQLEAGKLSSEQVLPWLRQLAWAEFAKTLLWHFPETEYAPFQEKFKHFNWQRDERLIECWQTGQTGIPIIDAGMRELWQTGTMHNRVRMLVASFLTKNLNQSWLVGKEWFDHTLLDADPANNCMGWQWVAGCGVDAAPYYRLFNPVVQSQKFDPDGVYIKTWVPELKGLSNKAIHVPWEFEAECQQKNIKLGQDYPYPVLALKQSRESHLRRVSALRDDS